MPPNAKQELDTERSGATSILVKLVAAFAMWCAHAAAVAGLIAVFVTMVPKFSGMFMEMDVSLPAITVLVLRLSRFVIAYWYLLVMLVVFADGPMMVGLSFLPRRLRWIRTTWVVVPLLAAIALLVLVVVALMIPTQGLVQDLSG